MTKTPRDVLMLARALIADPDNWTRFRMARDKDDKDVSVLHPDACKFCAIGAVRRVSGVDDDSLSAILRLNRAATSVSDGVYFGMYALNDSVRSASVVHRQVLAAYDLAIAQSDSRLPMFDDFSETAGSVTSITPN